MNGAPIGQTRLRATRRAFLALAARVAAAGAAASLTGCRQRLPGAPSASTLAPAAGFSGTNSLSARAAAHGLLYGCAVDVRALAADAAYADLVRAEASIVVAENAMKWGALRPNEGSFRFDEADALVAFAEANHMKIRGHNLVWHRDNPAWLGSALNSTNAHQLLVDHIETVVGRYAGRMHSWDVVNEAVLIPDGRPDGLRLSPWLTFGGDDYIELAFRTARNADPQALLTYNDYGIEGDSPAAEQKRQSILVLLRRLITRAVPIDAVGIQSHLSAANVGNAATYAGLMRFIAEVRGLGLQVFLTELDVNDRGLPLDQQTRDAVVAATYEQFLEQTLGDAAVRAVLTWGITDRYTWLNHEGSRSDGQPERPLPFDSACLPKATAFAMRAAFDSRHAQA
jgi:endo-1,4-beta-xylanase